MLLLLLCIALDFLISSSPSLLELPILPSRTFAPPGFPRPHPLPLLRPKLQPQPLLQLVLFLSLLSSLNWEAESQYGCHSPSLDPISHSCLFPHLQSDSALVSRIKAVYQFNVVTEKGTQSWTVDLKTGPNGSVSDKGAEKADCTITMKEADFVSLMSGKLDAQKAFMEGKLKMSGNMQLAMKLGDIIKPAAKL